MDIQQELRREMITLSSKMVNKDIEAAYELEDKLLNLFSKENVPPYTGQLAILLLLDLIYTGFKYFEKLGQVNMERRN